MNKGGREKLGVGKYLPHSSADWGFQGTDQGDN